MARIRVCTCIRRSSVPGCSHIRSYVRRLATFHTRELEKRSLFIESAAITECCNAWMNGGSEEFDEIKGIQICEYTDAFGLCVFTFFKCSEMEHICRM